MLQNSSIPQFIIQENFIIEGDNNQVEQFIDQTLVFYPISSLQLENSEILQLFVQNNFTNSDTAQVNQKIEQSSPNIPFFSNHFQMNGTEHTTLRDFNIELSDFLNSDGQLDSVQSVNQAVDVLGNNNEVIQTSEQNILDFRLVDSAFFGDEENQENLISFDEFLVDIAGDVTLDSLQFALQDVIVQGSNNQIEQSIEQLIVTFLVIDEDRIEVLIPGQEIFSPTQAIIQENFIGDGETEVSNNQVNQQIKQTITLDTTFSDSPEINLELQVGQEADQVNFDIDLFIETILETSLSSSQRLIQTTQQTGDNNQAIEENSQDLSLVNPGELVFGSQANDTLQAGINAGFDGLEDIVFPGAGNDLVELPNPTFDLLDVPTQTRVYGGSGNDHLFAESGDRIFGGTGDDELDASLGSGSNRLYGGLGNDILIAGNDDQLIGGKGDDQLLALVGTNNTLWGGSDSDEFWIANTELPTAINFIADFTPGEDQIRISGFDLTFEEINLYQNGADTVINIFDQDIAAVLKTSVDSLQENDFLLT